jgi:hypothetical protein
MASSGMAGGRIRPDGSGRHDSIPPGHALQALNSSGRQPVTRQAPQREALQRRAPTGGAGQILMGSYWRSSTRGANAGRSGSFSHGSLADAFVGSGAHGAPRPTWLVATRRSPPDLACQRQISPASRRPWQSTTGLTSPAAGRRHPTTPKQSNAPGRPPPFGEQTEEAACSASLNTYGAMDVLRLGCPAPANVAALWLDELAIHPRATPAFRVLQPDNRR